MEDIKKYLESPLRNYEEGVGLLAKYSRKWQVNPYFNRKTDPAKLEYELVKLLPAGTYPGAAAGTNPVVDNAKLVEPKAPEAYAEKAQGKEAKGQAETQNEPISIAGKIDRDKLTPEQQAMYDNYLAQYDVAVKLHNDLKAPESDDERKEILDKLIAQDELCGKLWNELEDSINGIEPEKETVAEKTEAEKAFEAGKKIKLLQNNIARIEKEIKDKKLKGEAKAKKKASIAEKQKELDELRAKYGTK